MRKDCIEGAENSLRKINKRYPNYKPENDLNVLHDAIRTEKESGGRLVLGFATP